MNRKRMWGVVFVLVGALVVSVAAPLALALAVGFAWAHRALDAPGRRGLQAILHGWAGALAAAVVLAFAG